MRTKLCKTITKPSAFLGIDPGRSGGAALLFSDCRLLFYDWPQSNNYNEVHRAIRAWKIRYKIEFGIMEKVASMHGQGVKSVWTFGQNYGAWLMLLVTLGIRHHLLTPTTWQKGLLTKTDGPDPKARVQNVVTRIFDEKYFFGPRGGYKDGRGDAALMAYKARLIHLKGELI